MINFLDKWGNVKPNSWDEQSENPLTFSAAFYFSALFNRKNAAVVNVFVFKAKYTTNNNAWRTMEYDPNPSWSIDEKISALAYFAYKENKEWLKKIPLLPRWSNSSKWSWFRPDVLAYTIGSKWSWLRTLMMPIILLKITHSFFRFFKDPKRESSGIQLAFIMACGWGQFAFVDQNKDHIKRAIDIYYPEEDHPTREIWRKP